MIIFFYNNNLKTKINRFNIHIFNFCLDFKSACLILNFDKLQVLESCIYSNLKLLLYMFQDHICVQY